MKLFKYIINGLITAIKVIFDFIKHIFIGIFYLPLILISIISHFILTFRIAFGTLHKDKQKKQNITTKQNNNKQQTKKEKIEDETYISENIKDFKKESFLEKIGNSIINIPKNIKKKWNNSSLVKNARQKKDINRQVLVIDFNGEDAKKSKTKQTYKYEIKTPEGKYVTGYFDAYSKVEVHSFLLSEGNTVYSIKTDKWIRFLHGATTKKNQKVWKSFFFH